MAAMRAAVLLLLLQCVVAGQADPVRAARDDDAAPPWFAARRARLAEAIGDGYALVLGQPLTDVLHPRQEGHFLYLTGVDDPGAALLVAGVDAAPLPIEGGEGDAPARSVLWLLHANPRFRQFYGLQWPVGRASATALGVDLTRSHPGAPGLGQLLAALLPEGATLHLPAYAGPDHAPVRELRLALLDALATGRADVRVEDLHPRLSALRAVKGPEEIERLRRAIAISLDVLREATARMQPGSSEAAVDGALIDGMRRRGARPAYPPVVATGAHAAIPHYMRNDAPLEAGQLLLIDAGAAYERYAADVTRVFPIGGSFTPRQRELLAIVRRAQAAGIEAVRPGATFADVDRAARTVIAEAGYGEHFLHGTSHHVGLDVHDPGPTLLQPGMTLTVEPGIYLPEENLGIRIEDVVLVTEQGHEVLSAALPSDADGIEALLR